MDEIGAKEAKKHFKRKIHEIFKKVVMDDSASETIEYYSVHNSEYDNLSQKSQTLDSQLSSATVTSAKEMSFSYKKSNDPEIKNTETKSQKSYENIKIDPKYQNFNINDLPEDIKKIYDAYVKPSNEEQILQETNLEDEKLQCKSEKLIVEKTISSESTQNKQNMAKIPIFEEPKIVTRNEKSLIRIETSQNDEKIPGLLKNDSKLDIKIDLFSKKIGDQESFFTSKNLKAQTSKWKIDLFEQFEKRQGIFSEGEGNAPEFKIKLSDTIVTEEKKENTEKQMGDHKEEDCCYQTKLLVHNYIEQSSTDQSSKTNSSQHEEDKNIQVSVVHHTDAERTDVLGLFLDCETSRIEKTDNQAYPKHSEEQIEIFDMGIGNNMRKMGDQLRINIGPTMRRMFDPRVDLFDMKTGGINLEIYEDLLAELDKTKLSLNCANKYIDSLRSLSEVDKTNFHKYVGTLKTNHEEHLKLLILQFMDFLYSVRFNYNKKSKDLVNQLSQLEQQLKNQKEDYEKQMQEYKKVAEKKIAIESNNHIYTDLKEKYLKVLETNHIIRNKMEAAKTRFGVFVREHKEDLEKYDEKILKMLLDYSRSMSMIEKDLICNKEEIDRVKAASLAILPSDPSLTRVTKKPPINQRSSICSNINPNPTPKVNSNFNNVICKTSCFRPQSSFTSRGNARTGGTNINNSRPQPRVNITPVHRIPSNIRPSTGIHSKLPPLLKNTPVNQANKIKYTVQPNISRLPSSLRVFKLTNPRNTPQKPQNHHIKKISEAVHILNIKRLSGIPIKSSIKFNGNGKNGNQVMCSAFKYGNNSNGNHGNGSHSNGNHGNGIHSNGIHSNGNHGNGHGSNGIHGHGHSSQGNRGNSHVTSGRHGNGVHCTVRACSCHGNVGLSNKTIGSTSNHSPNTIRNNKKSVSLNIKRFKELERVNNIDKFRKPVCTTSSILKSKKIQPPKPILKNGKNNYNNNNYHSNNVINKNTHAKSLSILKVKK